MCQYWVGFFGGIGLPGKLFLPECGTCDVARFIIEVNKRKKSQYKFLATYRLFLGTGPGTRLLNLLIWMKANNVRILDITTAQRNLFGFDA